jgi:hypothetical protein
MPRIQSVDKVRLVGEALYQSGTWDRERRVAYKSEALSKGPNLRFVVTTSADPPPAAYDRYVDRGEPGRWIAQLKATCFADRLSCHAFSANQVRLFLAAATYGLLPPLRSRLARAHVAPMRLAILRLTVLKIGGRVDELATPARLRLASSRPGQTL